ncbi:MAG: fatty acid desaturase family protein [Acidimicrobiales bacterium]
MALIDDDLSTSFGRARSHLVGPDGRSYGEFRAGLNPRWWLLWADLGLTWALLAGVVVVLAWLQGVGWPVAVGAVIIGTGVIGVLVHRVNLFLHEGAHFNLAPQRWNDLLTNIAAGALVLGDVRTYRPIHMAHHRNLGTVRDTERTYFSRLDLRFLQRCALGMHVVAVLRSRNEAPTDENRDAPWTVLAGCVGHAAIVVAAALTGHWILAVAWTLGVVSVFPLVTSVRQLSEHRPPDADGSTDYSSVDIGAHTRMFDRAPLSWVFGAAGFDHHLLHHWDPKVSYTRLPELRSWLEETEVGPVVDRRESTYVGTVQRLWRR